MNDKIKKKLEIHKLFLLAFALFLLPFVNALTLGIGTVLNTTSSNSSMTFSFNVSVQNVTIESNSVYLYWVIYTESGVDKFCPSINFSTPNSNKDSSEFKCPLTPSGGSGGTDSGAAQTGIGENIMGFTPHFYKEGIEVFPTKAFSGFSIVTPPGIQVDEIKFDISGTNTGPSIELKIVDASPQVFKDALPTTIQSLEVGESKILWTSALMETAQFEAVSPVNFWIRISGEDKSTGELIYREKYSGDISFEKGGVTIEEEKPIFSIELKPHYYVGGKETLIYSDKTKFDGIAFEVIGKNLDRENRILNLSIVNASTQILKDSFPDTIKELLKGQKKTLWTSDIMAINKFNQTNISLWVGVEGILENQGTYLYSEGHLNINLNAPEKNANLLYSIGNKIWEGNPGGGILILLLIVIIIGSFNWKYKGIEKLKRWRERTKRKRIERKRSEEGW